MLRRHVAPWTWIGGVKELAKQEPDLARRAALHELARVAKKIDLDCREAAKKTAKKELAAPRCCLGLATVCVFIIRTTSQREVRILDCEARLGDDDKIKLTWHGPNVPFDLDHLAWTEIPRIFVGDRVCNFC